MLRLLLLLLSLNCGIFGLVIEGRRMRLLVVTSWAGQTSLTTHWTSRNNFMSVHWWRLICWSMHQVGLGACWAFAALARVVVACEREHVGQVLTKLSRSWETSLSHTCHSLWTRSLVLKSVSSCIACINDVVLTVIEALCSILSKHGRVRGRCSWDDWSVWDASQMASLCRVQASQWWRLGRVESNAWGAMIGRLLFGVSANKAWVDNSYWVGARCTSTSWTDTTRISTC